MALLDHLITNTLVHWDQSMRHLGAQSLKSICELDLATLGPQAEAKVACRFSLSPTGGDSNRSSTIDHTP